MTVPLNPGTHPRDLPIPKKMVAGLVVCAMFGATATVASVVGAYTGTAQQKDVIRNREFLRATCENTRAITAQFASATPAPCPKEE